MMSIGANIKRLRELFDLTQKDLADIAGVTDKAVSTWETGLKEPRMGTIQKIADHFGIQKSNIIEENGMDIYARQLTKKPNIKVVDTENKIVVIDDETRDIIDSLRTNPEMKILFSVSKKATKEEIMQAVKIIKALRDEK